MTGEDVAIKVIDKNKIDEVSRLHIHKEVGYGNFLWIYTILKNLGQMYEIITSSTCDKTL